MPSDAELEVLKPYFPATKWDEITRDEKERYFAQREHYQKRLEQGFPVQLPDFMSSKNRPPPPLAPASTTVRVPLRQKQNTSKTRRKGKRKKTSVIMKIREENSENAMQESSSSDSDDEDYFPSATLRKRGKGRKKNKENARAKSPRGESEVVHTTLCKTTKKLRAVQRQNYTEPDVRVDFENDDEFVYCDECEELIKGFCRKHCPLWIQDQKVTKRDGSVEFVDATDETKSNWMRFINSARPYYGDEYGSVLEYERFMKTGKKDVSPVNNPGNLLLSGNQDSPPPQDEDGCVCRYCGKKFRNAQRRKLHEYIHTGQRPFVCEYCFQRFKTPGHLQGHIRSHTGSKPFGCDKCGASFTESSKLTRHNRVHTAEKPLACAVCGRCFADSSSLRRHTRIHSGERPYPCRFCSLKFSQSNDRSRHEKIHSRTNLLSCGQCHGMFARKQFLTLHLKKCSGPE